MSSEQPHPESSAIDALIAAGFLECVYHCPSCGLGGVTVSRPAMLHDKTCTDCDSPVVVSVFDRFPSRRA